VPARAAEGESSTGQKSLSEAPAIALRSTEALTPAGSTSSPLVRLLRCFFAFLGALPWWLPIARSRLPLGALGAVLDRFFIPMCHRIPERSLALEGVQMPLCSRCAGIFAGIAAGAVVARPILPMTVWRPILIASGVLMLLDVAAQDLGIHPVWHPSRIATGFALGYAMVTSFVTHLARRPS
jgi:uncharacterized membrane protein